jgi:hypothetical protein
MGDPITLGLAISSIAGAGVGISQALKKPPKPKPVSPPPTPDNAVGVEGKKIKKYRPAAQLFRDEELRLGVGGKLGM